MLQRIFRAEASFNGFSALKRPALVSTTFGAFSGNTKLAYYILSSIMVPDDTPASWDRIFDQICRSSFLDWGRVARHFGVG
jgi:hypothetical protein